MSSQKKRNHIIQSSDSEDDELFSFQPFPASSPSKSPPPTNEKELKHHNKTIVSEDTANQSNIIETSNEGTIETKAREKTNSLCVPFEITSPSELFFYMENKAHNNKGKKRYRKLYHPCRICHPDEGKFLNINKAYDKDKKCLVQYFDPKSFAFRDVQIIPKKSLIPYHGKDCNFSETDMQASWCKDTMNSYKDQLHQEFNKNKRNKNPHDIEIQILSAQLYLDRVLRTAQDRCIQQQKEEERKLQARRKYDEGRQLSLESQELSQSSKSAIISQSQDVGNPYEDSEEEDIDMLINGSQKKKTQIRAGDVIVYFAPHGQWGDKRYHRRAKIINVKSRYDTFPLELDNGEFLEKNVKIMVVEKIYRGEMKEFHGGSWLEIKDFSLKSGVLKGYENSSGLSLVVEEQRNVIRQQINDTKEKLLKEGFGDCSDVFQVI